MPFSLQMAALVRWEKLAPQAVLGVEALWADPKPGWISGLGLPTYPSHAFWHVWRLHPEYRVIAGDFAAEATTPSACPLPAFDGNWNPVSWLHASQGISREERLRCCGQREPGVCGALIPYLFRRQKFVARLHYLSELAAWNCASWSEWNDPQGVHQAKPSSLVIFLLDSANLGHLPLTPHNCLQETPF